MFVSSSPNDSRSFPSLLNLCGLTSTLPCSGIIKWKIKSDRRKSEVSELTQELANYDPWAKFGLVVCFGRQNFIGLAPHSCVYLLPMTAFTTKAELSSCNSDLMCHKAQYIYYLALTKEVFRFLSYTSFSAWKGHELLGWPYSYLEDSDS
jgi:hypothetical protein